MVFYSNFTDGDLPLAVEGIRTATISPARLLHATDSLGTVERGKVADLVLLDADPLDDITNVVRVHAVVAAGRLHDRSAIDALLAKARRAIH